jgi:hypothetical protein
MKQRGRLLALFLSLRLRAEIHRPDSITTRIRTQLIILMASYEQVNANYLTEVSTVSNMILEYQGAIP